MLSEEVPGVLAQGGLDGGPAVLPVVDDQASLHGDAQPAQAALSVIGAHGIEADVAVDECRQGREDLVVTRQRPVPDRATLTRGFVRALMQRGLTRSLVGPLCVSCQTQ